MSTYTVTDSPAFLFYGDQESVSLYNNGPSTVYLDDHSAINEANSYPLPPTGTMTWKAYRPLYAKTAYGESRLTGNTAGNISDASRASLQRTIWRGPGDSGESFVHNETPLIETSAYRSLIIAGSGDPEFQTYPKWRFSWYDDDQNLISQEWTQFWYADNNFTVTTPVNGSFVSIQFYADFYLYPVASTIRIIGTSQTLDWSAECAPRTVWHDPVPPAGTFTSKIIRKGYIGIRGWDFSPLLLPNWGTQIQVGILSTELFTNNRQVQVFDTHAELGSSRLLHGWMWCGTGSGAQYNGIAEDKGFVTVPRASSVGIAGGVYGSPGGSIPATTGDVSVSITWIG